MNGSYVSFTAQSVVTAILLFTLFALIACLLIRYAKWSTLHAVSLCLGLALLRLALPVELFSSKCVPLLRGINSLQELLFRPMFKGRSLLHLLIPLWMFGSSLLLGHLIARLLYQRRVICKSAIPESHPLAEIYRSVAAEMGCAKTGQICVCRSFSAPMMAGFLRAHLLLPENVNELSEGELRCAIRHELAHFLGHDLWYKLLLELLCCLLWWNPVVYLLRRAACQLLELRCDARACAALSEKERVNYSSALLHALRLQTKAKPLVAVGYLGNPNRSYIKRRFQQILQPIKTRPKRLLSFALMLLMCAMFLGSYAFVLDSPGAMPEEMSGYSTQAENPDAERNFILHYDNGNYVYFEDMRSKDIISKGDLTREPYCDLPIYEANISYEWEE